MKKTFLMLLSFIAITVLVACKPEVRAQEPVLIGVQTVVNVEVGDAFNPLAGITAKDPEKDITDKITTTFDAKWLLAVGEYRYNISVTNDAGLTATQTVTLIVGAGSQTILVAPNALTYYIGSKTFNPLDEVRAYDSVSQEAIEVEVEEINYPPNLNVPGKYSYTVTAGNDDSGVIKQTIDLYIKPAADILTELPKNQKIQISMWHSNGSSIETALKRYATQFQAEMAKDGYDIEVSIVKNGANYDELRTNVINALKGGTLPNIVQNYPDHVVEYNANNIIESLTPYIQHKVHGYNDEIEVNGVKSDTFLDILESYRAEQRATNSQGDYISLPFNKSTEVVAYNKDIFDAVLKGNPFPETWQDLFELTPEINKIKDAYIDQIALRWQAAGSPLKADEIAAVKANFTPFVYDSQDNAFITMVRQFGGTYTSRDESTGKGVLNFDNDITRQMLTFFGENRSSVFTLPSKWEASYTNEVSKTGQAIFGVGSTGGVHYNTPVQAGFKLFNIGVAPVPYDKYQPNSRSVIQQGTNVSLTTEGTQAEKLASWYFIKYLTSNAVQEDFSKATGYTPIRNSVYTSDSYQEYLSLADFEMKGSAAEMGMTAGEYEDKYKSVVKAMGLRAATEQRQYQFFDTPFIGSSAARAAVGVAFERVILAPADADLKKAIDDAIAYAVAEAQKGMN